MDPKHKLWNKKDYLYFFGIIPLILTLIYLMPFTFKETLKHNFTNPSFIGIFLSSYNHLDLNHFLGNIFIYLIFLTFIFYFETNKKRFYISSIIGFFLSPFILFSLEYILFRTFSSNLISINSWGFSGITSFFIGYFIYTFYSFCKVKLNSNIKLRFLNLIVIFSLIGGIFNINFKTGLIVSGLFALICLDNLKDIKIIIIEGFIIPSKEKKIIESVVFAVAILLLFFSSLILIPREIVRDGRITNILVHYLGYLLGVLFPFCLERFKVTLSKNLSLFFKLKN